MRVIAAGALLLGQLAGQVFGGVAATSGGESRAGVSAWSWPLSGAGGGPPAVVRPFQPPMRRWDAGHRGLDLVGAADPGAAHDPGSLVTPGGQPGPYASAHPGKTDGPGAGSGPTDSDSDSPVGPGASVGPGPGGMGNLSSLGSAGEQPGPGPDTSADAPVLVRAAGPGRVSFAGPLFGQGVIAITHDSATATATATSTSVALRTSYEPVMPVVEVGEQVARGQVIGILQPGHCADRPCLHWGLLAGHGRQIRYYDPSILLGPGRVRLEPVRSR